MSNASEIPLSLYPIIVRQARYSGIYEGGLWLASSNCDAIPSEELMGYLEGDDCDAWAFLDDKLTALGVGNTPDTALADLIHKINNASAVETPPQSNQSSLE